MIYSEWQPDGGYQYFETEQRHGIGDDLPNVVMPSVVNGIGVPVQDVGRTVPGGAKSLGFGAAPKGLMAPMARGNKMFGLSGVDGPSKAMIVLGGVAFGMAIGYAVKRWAPA